MLDVEKASKRASIEDVKKLKGLPLDDEGLVDVVRVGLDELGFEVLLEKYGGRRGRYSKSIYVVTDKNSKSKCYKVTAIIDLDIPAVADVKYAEIPRQVCETILQI
jgi:hypothetical protein